MFPELVSQEGKVRVELLTAVTGFPHQGTWRWESWEWLSERSVGLARDLLENLSFVEQDRVGGVDVEQEAGLVLLDSSDGELHCSGTGKYWGPRQGNQGRLIDIQAPNTNTGTLQRSDGRSR